MYIYIYLSSLQYLIKQGMNDSDLCLKEREAFILYCNVLEFFYSL